MKNRINRLMVSAILFSVLPLFTRCMQDDPMVESMQIAPLGNDTLFAGKEYQLEVLFSPASVSNPRLSWSVSDAQLASIQYGGVLKPLKSGQITVYVNSLQSGGKKVGASRKFILLSSGVYLKDKSVTINPLEVKKMEYKFLPEDYRPSEKLTWSSDDETIASIDEQGNLRGLQAGNTIIRLRLGNLLSGFYSEDSCLITVQNFVEPRYTYTNGVLNFEQDVPGLLPMIAGNMPHFTNIVLKGPVNGNDFMFFIENSQKIEALDLANTYVVKGGRTLRIPPSYPQKERIMVIEDNYVPKEFFEMMKIESLIVPPALHSIFGFGNDFVLQSLTFPDSYETIEIASCNVHDLHLPQGLRNFRCNTEALLFQDQTYNNTLPVFNKPLKLPASLKTLHCLAKFQGEVTLPPSVEEVSLGESFGVLRFEPNTKLRTIDKSIVARNVFYPGSARLTIEEFTLPEGLEIIGNMAFGNMYESFFTFRHIRFPSTLKKIAYGAFINADIEGTITLPEGLQSIEHSAFSGSTLSEIVLPSTIATIGSEAFSMCSKLERVHIKRATPPQTGTLCFQRSLQMGRMHQLIVPQGAKQAYIDAGYNEFFFEIIEE